MSHRPVPGLALPMLGLALGISTLSGCGNSPPASGQPVTPIPVVNPTPNNPNVPVDEEYKHMEKLQKGIEPAK